MDLRNQNGNYNCYPSDSNLNDDKLVVELKAAQDALIIMKQSNFHNSWKRMPAIFLTLAIEMIGAFTIN